MTRHQRTGRFRARRPQPARLAARRRLRRALETPCERRDERARASHTAPSDDPKEPRVCRRVVAMGAPTRGMLFLGTLIAMSVSTSARAVERVKVPDVAFDDLVREWRDASAGEGFRRALMEDGMVTVRDVPGFASLRRRVMTGVSACGALATSARVTDFPDGTSRRTVAAVTEGFRPRDDVDLEYAEGDARAAEACSEDLLADVKTFRELVSSVSRAFVERLGESFPSRDGSPMLRSADAESDSFEDVGSLVGAGEHLEHFHAYSRGDRSPAGDDAASSGDTIDLHVDQGMFIMFTPGVVVDLSQTPPAMVKGESPGSFFIERRDGTIVECDFGFNDDVLVVMLGDGVDAIVNPKMPEGVVLRSAPHAMKMPDLSSGWVRSWYGRMFLAPSSAVHDERTGISYGEMREMAIDSVRAGGGEGTAGVGCSRRSLHATDTGTTCTDSNKMYCWMRCMTKVDCSSAPAGHTLKCASQRDEIWRPEDSHGDYNPTCTNSTANVTDDPLMPSQYKNAPSGGCSTNFADYLAQRGPSGEAWTNQRELIQNKLYLQWRRCTTTTGAIEMRMVHDGSFGYLAIGLENVGGGHNGMNGARIVMGIYDPDANAHGGPSWLNYVGTGVRELKIHDTLSAFRHWKNSGPSSSGLLNSTIDVNPGCGSSMYFKTKKIHGTALNMTGCTNFIWATDAATLLKGYHGRTSRGFVKINFALDSGVFVYDSLGNTDFGCAASDAASRARGFVLALLATAACLAW